MRVTGLNCERGNVMKMGSDRRTKWSILFVVLSLAANSQSAEKYRNFKNQSGKAIHARIVQYDAEAGKVELELKTRKKAWVEISTLSDEDQAFINQWQQDKTAEAKKLSEEEVRAIAEQYIKAWEERDYQLWAKLVGPMQERVHGESLWKQQYEEGALLEIEDIDRLNVQLNVKTKGGAWREGWLQMLPDGRIKYTPLLFQHPLFISFRFGLILYLDVDEESNTGTKRSAIDYFRNNDIPLFGYKLDESVHRRKRSAKKILDWMIEEGATWDATDPKVPLPEEQFKALIEECKVYSSRF